MEFKRARRPEQVEQRRRTILDTACAMLRERPVADISLRELSDRVGLAKSNVLRYFDSREAIFLEVLDEEWGAWLDELEGALAPAGDVAGFAGGAAGSAGGAAGPAGAVVRPAEGVAESVPGAAGSAEGVVGSVGRAAGSAGGAVGPTGGVVGPAGSAAGAAGGAAGLAEGVAGPVGSAAGLARGVAGSAGNVMGRVEGVAGSVGGVAGLAGGVAGSVEGGPGLVGGAAGSVVGTAGMAGGAVPAVGAEESTRGVVGAAGNVMGRVEGVAGSVGGVAGLAGGVARAAEGAAGSPAGGAVGEAVEVARTIAASLLRRRLMCELVSGMAGVLERNIQVGSARVFKRKATARTARLAHLVRTRVPVLDDAAAQHFAGTVLVMTAGLWPCANPTEAVAQVMREMGAPPADEAFRVGLTEGLVNQLVGLVARA